MLLMGRYLQEQHAWLMKTTRSCQISKMNFHGGVTFVQHLTLLVFMCC